MPGTDIIVVNDTILHLGAATSATSDELIFGVGSILTIESDSPVSLFPGGISGEGELNGTSSGVTITGLDQYDNDMAHRFLRPVPIVGSMSYFRASSARIVREPQPHTH